MSVFRTSPVLGRFRNIATCLAFCAIGCVISVYFTASCSAGTCFAGLSANHNSSASLYVLIYCVWQRHQRGSMVLCFIDMPALQQFVLKPAYTKTLSVSRVHFVHHNATLVHEPRLHPLALSLFAGIPLPCCMHYSHTMLVPYCVSLCSGCAA